jgi:signal transduction histidine kinase
MVIVFAVILHNTKTNIFTALSSTLQTIIAGGPVDPDLLHEVSAQLDRTNLAILVGMVLFAAITGILAARITLAPTQQEFDQRKKFITAVAHELRTPLAVMRTSNEVALYDLSDTNSIKEVINQNIEETKRIANILNNLIVFSRVGAAESMTFERVALQSTIETVQKKLLAFAQKNKVEITYSLAELPFIYANETALEQVFYNIIKNAINYSKKGGGEVKVEAYANASYAVVTVTDNGIGISQANLPHIFEPFFRINPDDSQFAGGTGLGLSLVFEILKLHRGIITVESTLGEGTKFTLQFPLLLPSLIQETVPHSSDSLSFSFER